MKDFEDDFCDIGLDKICDNCGKCLELDGVDTKAINLQEISKIVEEKYDVKDEEVKEELEDLENLEVPEDEALNSDIDWEAKLKELDSEYEDAFEHIEYIDDMDLNDDLLLEEMTEEVYPGVRRIKKTK